MIGGDAPSAYLSKIQDEAKRNQVNMNDILASHLICFNTLRSDDFRHFFEARKETLLKAIEESMGKKIIREGGDSPDTSAQ